MNVQSKLDITNRSIILDASLSLSKSDAILKQDGARAVPLVFGTLLAKIVATGKLVPFISEIAIDGTALPYAIYLGADVPAADLVAGDIEDVNVLIGGGAVIDINRLVIEGGKLLTTIIGVGTISALTVEDSLANRGIFMGESDETSSFEN